MGKYQDYKKFPKLKIHQKYLFPNVCFDCRKSFKKPRKDVNHKCPQCEKGMIVLSRKFHAPKMTDIEQWEKVKYLVDNGFYFETVFENVERGVYRSVPYPETKKEAFEFVKKYRPNIMKEDREKFLTTAST
jgi:predicted RNA-binding Zn-ribbon protein involved in translation (DUF1610 family)